MNQNNGPSIIGFLPLPLIMGWILISTIHQQTQLNESMFNTTYKVDVDKDMRAAVYEVNLACTRVAAKNHLKVGARIRVQDFLSELSYDYAKNIKPLGDNAYWLYPNIPARSGIIITLDKVPVHGEPFAVGLNGHGLLPATPPKENALFAIASKFYDRFPKDAPQSHPHQKYQDQ